MPLFLGSVLQHTGPSLDIGQSSLARSSLLCEADTGGKESKVVKDPEFISVRYQYLRMF